MGFDTIEELDQALSPRDFERLPLPYETGFLAAKAFVRYRGRGGTVVHRYRTSTSARTPQSVACAS